MPSCYIPSANPRSDECLRCGKLKCRPEREGVGGSNPAGSGTSGAVSMATPVSLPNSQPDSTRPRDLSLERELTLLAARAAGHESDYGLRKYADARSMPGGVRTGIDWDEEAGAEVGDAANYLVWGIIEVYERVEAGDPVALDLYERRMRTLSALIECWRQLLTEAA